MFKITVTWGPTKGTTSEMIVSAPSLAMALDHVKNDEKVAALPNSARLLITVRLATDAERSR